MSEKKHPNSRIVTVFWKESFLAAAQEATAPDFLANAKKSIGAYWASSTSKAVATGLDFAEQQLLLPSLVDCEVSDRNFRSAVTKYYENIKTVIPFGKGRQLEIGLTEDNNKPLSATNQPLELTDYIAYRHLVKHPQVAASKDDPNGLLLKEFYIFDPAAAEEKRLAVNDNKDKALSLYLDLKEQPDKMNMILTLMNVDPRQFNDKKNTSQLKIEKLKSLVDTTPDKFLEVLGDKFLEDKYWIQTLLNLRLLKNVGTMVLDAENDAVIGNNFNEALSWFRDVEHSEAVVIYKARAKEMLSVGTASTSPAEKSV